MHPLNDQRFWLAAAYAVAMSDAVDKSPPATAESSQDLFRLPTHQSVQSSSSSLSGCNVSAKNYSSGRSFSTAYDSDVSSLGFSCDSVDMKVFIGTSSTLAANDSSSSCQHIGQREACVVSKQSSQEAPVSTIAKRVNSCANGKAKRTTSERNITRSPPLSSDLELVNTEADMEAHLVGRSGSVRNVVKMSTAGGSMVTRSQKNMNLRKWTILNQMETWQKQWIEKIQLSRYSRNAATAHVVDTWKALRRTYSTFASRSSNMQQSLKVFVCNAIKLSEFLVSRGCKELSTLLPGFMASVVAAFMKNRKHLHEFSRCWMQSREILRMVCEIPSHLDTLLALLASVGESKLRFLKTMTSECIDRDSQFMNYVVNEMNDLEARVSQRIHQLQRKETFGLSS